MDYHHLDLLSSITVDKLLYLGIRKQPYNWETTGLKWHTYFYSLALKLFLFSSISSWFLECDTQIIKHLNSLV